MKCVEKYKKKEGVENMSMKLSEASTNELYGKRLIKTYLKDVITNLDTGEVEIREGHNLIVIGFSKLIAALLKNEAGYVGLQYWAVGEGEGSSWDDLTLEELEAKSIESLTQLYGEVARVAISMEFLDGDNNPTASVTDKLQIQATFGTSVSGYLREFGIFGGNATTTLNSGLEIDHVAHPLISLNISANNMQLERTLILQL